MRTCRRITAALAAATLATAVGLTSATPAQAASCQAGEFCIYEHNNWQGRISKFTQSPYSIADYYLNDKVSSVVNRSDSIWILYQHSNCSGWWEWVSPGAFYNLAKVHNDQTSCIKRLS